MVTVVAMSSHTVSPAFAELLCRREWITVGEYAEGRRISRATAYRHVSAGHVPSTRVGPKLLRIPTGPLRAELGLELGTDRIAG